MHFFPPNTHTPIIALRSALDYTHKNCVTLTPPLKESALMLWSKAADSKKFQTNPETRALRACNVENTSLPRVAAKTIAHTDSSSKYEAEGKEGNMTNDLSRVSLSLFL